MKAKQVGVRAAFSTRTELPRERLNWRPWINLDACIGNRQCVDFCKRDVFDWDEESEWPIVARPLNCVLGCSACASLCPMEAIRLRPVEKLRAQMRRLRQELELPGVIIEGCPVTKRQDGSMFSSAT